MINVNIPSIVKNLDSNIDFLQPLYESIINSFQANATNVDIEIYGTSTLTDEFKPLMVGFSITDDGDGFTEKNIESFCTLWSDYKLELGCKGSGRFTWLNVFNSIEIVSKVSSYNTLVKIPFSIDFDPKDVSVTNASDIEKSVTTIVFKYVTEKYFKEPSQHNHLKGYDKRCFADPSLIKKSILDYLFVTLAQMKEKGRHFKITIKTESSVETIVPADIKELSKHCFTIENDFNGNNQTFIINYAIKKDKGGVRRIVLCSNERSTHIIKPASVGINDKLPDNDSLFVFITSEYLNNLDTDDRRGLDTYASSNKEADLVYSISYSDLLTNITLGLKTIIEKEYPGTKESNKAIIDNIRASKPYLDKYISDNDSAIVSADSVEANAIKAFEKDKIEVSKKFSKALKERDIDPDAFAEAVADLSSISTAELGEYILYRSQILDALTKECIKNKNEAYIHNIFMPKNTSSNSNEKYLNTNMWILDDKFMSYIYASSDLSIKKINENMFKTTKRTDNDLLRPDALIIYDRNDGIRNAVIIEYKAYSASLDEKFKSLRELSDNSAAFRKANPDINSIWAYVITKLDDKFVNSIRNDGSYTELFTAKGAAPSFYRYNENVNVHIFVCDIDSIVEEAKIRNSVFSNIVKTDKQPQ